MSTFTVADTFNLPLEHVVIVRVSAYNDNGWGLASETNTEGAYVRTPPTFMNAPIRSPDTNDHQLHVYWEPLSSDLAITGGSAIISYGLEWDAATDRTTWYQLSGFSSNVLSTEFIVQTDVVNGMTYWFRLSGRNIYDWSPVSELLEVAAAGVPEQTEVPTTEIDPDNGQNVLVSWTTPYDNSDPIIAYEIVFRRVTDGLYEAVDECVSEDPTLVLSCSIPITVFTEVSTFNLAYNDLIKVRVRARNTNDWGDFSESNIDGARI